MAHRFPDHSIRKRCYQLVLEIFGLSASLIKNWAKDLSCRSQGGFHNAIFPRSIISDQMFFFKENLTDKRFKSDQMIIGAPLIPESTLIIRDKVIGFKEPNESNIDHLFATS